jgi:hypothetical protein
LPPAWPGKLAAAFLLGGAVIALGAASVYTVQPTEMAGVRRLGTVVTHEPVGPGLHFKLPFVDVVDTIQTSLDMLQMNNLTVYTIDNQAVSVGVGLSYHIPPSAVMHLLYGVGRSGNIDIAEFWRIACCGCFRPRTPSRFQPIANRSPVMSVNRSPTLWAASSGWKSPIFS